MVIRAPVQVVASMALCAAVLGCKLDEVTVPIGDPVVVVQAIMREDRNQQFVIVERSFSGAVDPDELGSKEVPAENGPQIPIENAIVEVTNLDFPGDPCGAPTTFTYVPQNPLLPRLFGVYWAPPNCPTLRPGDRLTLRVQTPDTVVVTGQTRIPGMLGATLDVAGQSVALGGPDTTVFNRDRDTLRVTIDAIVGRLVQLEVKRLEDESSAAGSKLFADSTVVALPGDLPDVLPGGGGEDIFRGGRGYLLTASLSDTNYFDFARSRNNPLTGRGFINRLDGGIGVFGSLTALSTIVEAESDIDNEREGTYQLFGTIMGITIDATFTMYLARGLDSTQVSAFVTGQWVMGVRPRGGPLVWLPRVVDSWSVDGLALGNDLELIMTEWGAQDPIGDMPLQTTLSESDSMAVTVFYKRPLSGTQLLGEITAVKQ